MSGSIASAMASSTVRSARPELLVVRVVAPVEQPELRLVADDEAEVGGEAELHLLARALGLHHGASDGRQQVLGDGVDQLQVQGPLRGEVLVEQRFGDPGRLGDVVHRRGAVPPVGEQLERHREELVASLFRREPPRTRPGSHLARLLRLPNGHAGPGRPGTRRRTRDSRAGRSARLKWSAATRWLCASSRSSGRRSHAASGAGSDGVEPVGSRTPPARPPPGRSPPPAGADGSPTPPRGCRSPPTSRAAATASQAA